MGRSLSFGCSGQEGVASVSTALVDDLYKMQIGPSNHSISTRSLGRVNSVNFVLGKTRPPSHGSNA